MGAGKRPSRHRALHPGDIQRRGPVREHDEPWHLAYGNCLDAWDNEAAAPAGVWQAVEHFGHGARDTSPRATRMGATRSRQSRATARLRAEPVTRLARGIAEA